MSSIKNALWVEKYRPTTIDEYVFHDDQLREAVHRMISENSLPHLLLSGTPGSGKTTLAQVLIHELGMNEFDVLTINASDENSVDVMRDKIKQFIMTCSMGDYKIVLLDEADYVSAAGQSILRRLMEDFSDSARFILTCNYENKIIPAVISRCQHYHFKKPNKDDIAEFVVTILASERVKFDLDLVDTFVATGYPDIRKIVNSVQQHSINGVLQSPLHSSTTKDYKFQLLDFLKEGDWEASREVVCASVSSGEWEAVYRFMYENLHYVPEFKDKEKWNDGIVVIAEHLYKHTLCSDSEINFAAMMIRLSIV